MYGMVCERRSLNLSNEVLQKFNANMVMTHDRVACYLASNETVMRQKPEKTSAESVIPLYRLRNHK